MMVSAVLFANAPTENLSIFDPVSPSGFSIRELAIFIFAVTGAIFLVVEAVLIYSIIKFRRTPTTNGNEPPQVYGSHPIEIAWTAAPALIVFMLVLIVARTNWDVRPNVPGPNHPQAAEAVFVDVVGRQWWWEYRYQKIVDDEKNPGKKKFALDFITANELHIPAGIDGVSRPVYLKLKSADVCHSFWVPRLAGKVDLIPGRINDLYFQTDNPGLYLGQCAEYCGTQHAKMLLRVFVDTPSDYDAWLANERKPAVVPTDEKIKLGMKAFESESCVNCHRIAGTPAVGTYAPDLTHLMSRTTLASGIIPNTRENLRAWVIDPQKIKPGCLMPAFQLSTGNVDAIVDYLMSLK